MSIENVQKVLAQADKHDWEEGLVAYPRYNQLLRDIAKYYDVGFVQTVAAFASLSPNNDYMGNLRSLVSLIRGIKEGRPLEDITVATYKACRDRAYDYMIGEKDFLMMTEGPKIRAFYHNIIRPECKKHVTIDGHMYGVWVGKLMVMRDVAYLKIPYYTIEYAFKKVAREHNLIPNQIQAILWFTWKRINQVVYKPQMNLFSEGNHWNLLMPVEDIKPYD